MPLDLVDTPARSKPHLVTPGDGLGLGTPRGDGDATPRHEGAVAPGAEQATMAANPDFLHLETLALNFDASLGVHSRPHFFNWTQGLLQSLIKHEVLVCALRNGQPLLFRVDSFSTATSNATMFGEMLMRESALAPNIIKAWEARRFKPLSCGTRDDSPFAGSAFAREVERLGASHLVVHGCHDASGQVTSLFVFACRPETVSPRQEYFAELLVPFLHSAWVRTRLNRPEEAAGGRSASGTSPLTARELEILRWIYLGKSNFEIGAILRISPLTVKNHVQKILRKLDVVNRTQAVGKALESRILNP